MAEARNPVRVEEMDLAAMLPWLRLFRSFRMAIAPAKLLLALLLVVLIFVGGRVLDAAWGPQAYPGEVAMYGQTTAARFAAWREQQAGQAQQRLGTILAQVEQADFNVPAIMDASLPMDAAHQAVRQHFSVRRAELQETLAYTEPNSPARQQTEQQLQQLHRQQQLVIEQLDALEPRGVFDTALTFALDAFGRMVKASTSLRFGFAELLGGRQRDPRTAVGAVYDMAVVLPTWMWHQHPWFMVIFMTGALVVWSLLGGAITRLAALEATRGQSVSAIEGVRFASIRWGWFLLTPVLPLLLAGLLGLLLIVGGLVFFNVAVLDILGGLSFGLALLIGFVIALLLLLLAGGVHLFYPALAVEGTDTFDAISRAFGYLLNRPWQWLFYTLVAMVYGAITYLFVGLLIFLTLLVTQRSIHAGVFRQTADGTNRFEAILPRPELGQLAHQMDWSQTAVPLSAKIASGLVWVWVFLLIGLLAAYAISFYLSAHTWIYLLLRRSAEGTEYDDVHEQPASHIEQV